MGAANADIETLDILTEYELVIDRESKDMSGFTTEKKLAKRDEKDDALLESFARLLESLGSGSIEFEKVDEKEMATMDVELLEKRSREASDNLVEDCVDIKDIILASKFHKR